MNGFSEELVQHSGRRIIRRPKVETMTGLKRSHIYALMKKDKFPKTIPLSERAVGWDLSEVEQWVDERYKHRMSR
ncbi:MAG: AlpA family transcriptional regulator [Azoarcus sp.]|jgi:prophage regulatory protein|nr:AlpA family transcriptional regulator [Azoarcus sp.]